jgi:uncharacterized membrane protein
MSGLSLEFASQWFLVFLLLLPIIYLLSRNSLAGLGSGRRKFAVTLRTIVLFLIILAISRARVMKENEALSVIFVVDRSDSIRPEMRREILQYIMDEAQFQRRESKGDEVGVVLFGKNAGIEVSSDDKFFNVTDVKTLVDTEATDIQAAIRLAVAAFPQDVGGKRLVLFTDGNETQGKVLEEIRNARSLGVTVDAVPIYSTAQAEFWVEKVVVDPEVKISQPYDLKVVVGSNSETKARVTVYENGALISEPDGVYDLKKGKTIIPFPNIRRDKPDFYKYEVRVEPVEKGLDVIDENNIGTAFVLIQGEPKILYVLPGGDEEEFQRQKAFDQPLLSTLASESIKVDVIRADFLPRYSGEYLDYDAIVFSNVGAHELTEEKMKLIHGLVYGIGIGFVMIGGENSFGAGGYQGTAIEKLLPVNMEIKQRKVLPNGAIAFVVHSCELGNGNRWARQVVQRAIRILSPRDYCGVLYHDSVAQEKWLFDMTRCSKKPMMLRKLRNFNPGDMMSFQQIFKMAAVGLKKTNASIKHMLILSDGDPRDPLPADVRDLVVNGRVTISTICYGAHGGGPPPIMEKLAKEGNGKFYHLTDPKKLPEIFIREATTVRKSLLSNTPFIPEFTAKGPFTGALEAALASNGSITQLDGHVVTSPKPLAVLHLVSPPKEDDPTRDPVLASWHYGLGKSVAFTSDAGRSWGKRWTKWSGYDRFWLETIRWVSRSRSEAPFRVSRQVEGNRARIIIDVVNETSGELDSNLKIAAMVVSPGPEHTTTSVSARQTTSGRYELEFPADEEGTHTIAIQYERKDGTLATYSTGFTVSYSSEFLYREVNESLLKQITDAADGRYFGGIDNEDVDFFSRDYVASKSIQDIWHGLLLLATALFFIDIFVRRVLIDYAGLAQKSVGFVSSIFGKKSAPKEEDPLAVLLKKKEDARAREGQSGYGQAAATYEARESVESVEVAGDAASALGKAKGKGDAPKTKESKNVAGEEAEEAGYTSRLLAAKRRARKRKD